MEKMQEVLTKLAVDGRLVRLAGAKYDGLKPGYMYLLRVRGVNRAGLGEHSDEMYSNFTKPVAPPEAPQPPTIKVATLRSLEFEWMEPDKGGTAITGYRVMQKGIDKEITLSRSFVTFTWDLLFPGQHYQLKVQALNAMGDSPWSEWSDYETSKTHTSAAEVPNNFLATTGSWNSLSYEGRVPYNNGAVITGMKVQIRFVEAFDIGDWEPAIVASIKVDKKRVPGTKPKTFKNRIA